MTTMQQEKSDILTRMVRLIRKEQHYQETHVKLQATLEEQEAEVYEKWSLVRDAYNKTKHAESVVTATQMSVKNVEMNLAEVASVDDPPATVMMIIDCVCYILYGKTRDWDTTQRLIVQGKFIAEILTFDPRFTYYAYNDKRMTKVDETRFSGRGLYQTANTAGNVYGPLVQWIEANIYFWGALGDFEPLIDGLRVVEARASSTKVMLQEVEDDINTLEEKIRACRTDYAREIEEAPVASRTRSRKK